MLLHLTIAQHLGEEITDLMDLCKSLEDRNEPGMLADRAREVDDIVVQVIDPRRRRARASTAPMPSTRI